LGGASSAEHGVNVKRKLRDSFGGQSRAAPRLSLYLVRAARRSRVYLDQFLLQID